ncbi:MAG: hypothetical protein COZ34_04985 [Candidatus Pacebacteria bacterium CG_4_10_14_3_um_filter_34_15]|nr:MYG1 family protein [Candidatus Pacearchaeota archaeon]NCQ65871.1 MYG1 family protein [Candidatus Paceibacterota bacterium]OIO44806.1 MAG: hypothetical protein AUJ41_01730 [Candidatus Pacebacteria bacterium CG1_02_43_31]PIQ81429.1 MAG: hypothetical protein COV78_00275 [Candidatus Pacebacteria bacterium CG11_big_fil_rev_8_21_14_0_20_34_55]PIX81141.1 MAG: hypothetical protein COZ34_04985 [Candidatus Pacebacteria bacterium CG_4_10_14_3_um_filter_34_15]PJC43539.1 MAG: hypothetical protein CO039
MERQLIITHHAPDIDAIGAVWILKRFDLDKYADAKLAFTNPGETISMDAAKDLGFELHNTTHVDTGLGRFDHHQADKGIQRLSATMLVRDYVISKNLSLENDEALNIISEYITQIDHFEEIYWPDAGSDRYEFMIHELIRGIEFVDPHNDESQTQFGLTCLDSAYAILTQHVKAKEIIAEKGDEFYIDDIKCLALETRNDDTIKIAQKQGFELVIRKDKKLGNIRIKVRPDSKLNLAPLYELIKTIDKKATWYNHPDGKMLLNGTKKHHNQIPSKLSINEVIKLAKTSLSKKAKNEE